MESTQVQAAKILLDKLVSNAPAEVNIGGQADNPVNHTVAVAPMLTPEQWAATFGPK
ncbi:hypothetical protein [Methylobacter sp.]|uniref:hypothetical protein n=1 Tax=Methylobacter sp. TaxID=2051955 RepID=UPI0025DDBDA2|nr:hypothetical protein [Methylobacter sp.]